MQFARLFLLILFGSCLFSCDKAKPYAEKLRDALKRDEAPKQVVGLPEEEKLANVPPPPKPVKKEPVVDKTAKVAILGYHDFTESRRPTDMIININEFRAQMQAIKDAELPVISLRQFLDWKQGKGTIPPKAVMITIDDGWRDTHTLAMPVLKEFGYPFTCFLYKKYVGVGGRSMTHQQIRELAENGATICSHSISHRNMAKPPGRTAEEKTAWLKAELEDSHNFLEQNFSESVIKAFAYPYGIYSDRVMEMAGEFGYEACFTVAGGKVSWDSDNLKINRYIVYGNSASNFNRAISFGSGGATNASGRALMTEQRDKETGEVKEPLVKVYPPSGSRLKNRLPRIEVDVSNLSRIQEDSISMRISGMGIVPHTFDREKQVIAYQVPQRLRLDNTGVQVSFRHGGKRDKEVIGWNFKIDRLAEYLSADVTAIRSESNPRKDLALPGEEKEIPKEKESDEPALSPTDDLLNAQASSN